MERKSRQCESETGDEENDFQHVDEQKTISALHPGLFFLDVIPLYPIHSLLKRYKIQFSDEVSLRQIPNKEIINLTSPSVRLLAQSKSLQIFSAPPLHVIFHGPKPRLLCFTIWKTAYCAVFARLQNYYPLFVCNFCFFFFLFVSSLMPPPISKKYTKLYISRNYTY